MSDNGRNEDPSGAFTIRRRGEAAIVAFAGDQSFRQECLARTGAALREVCQGSPPPHVILDFQKVAFLTSEGLGVLIDFKKRYLVAGQRRLSLCGLCEDLREVFAVTRLNQVFDLYPDVDSALR